MKTLWIAAGLALLSTPATMASSRPACSTDLELKTSVEVVAGEFTLAELLAPNRCAALRQAAAQVTLGHSPLVGSMRVLSGAEVRAVLGRLSMRPGTRPGELASRFAGALVPERITVRRAGARANCAALEQRILDGLAPAALTSGLSATEAPQEMTCGAAGRVSQNAPLEVTQTVWDASRNSWQVRARCLHPGDCVPFQVRIAVRPPALEHSLDGGSASERTRRYGDQPAISAAAPPGNRTSRPNPEAALVRPGQTVALTWDQGGIRLVVSAVCLDLGGAGEAVRTRILGADGGVRLVRAVVEGAGRVRVAS
jgi:hypothetical protein